jgi:hypothetical protein
MAMGQPGQVVRMKQQSRKTVFLQEKIPDADVGLEFNPAVPLTLVLDKFNIGSPLLGKTPQADKH